MSIPRHELPAISIAAAAAFSRIACKKQTITMVKDTISGVPFTGRLNATRPITSAQTRKQRRNASVAAVTSSACASRSLIRSIIGAAVRGARRFANGRGRAPGDSSARYLIW